MSGKTFCPFLKDAHKKCLSGWTILFDIFIRYWNLSLKMIQGISNFRKNGNFLSFFSKPCLFSYDLYSFFFETKSIMSRWLFTLKKDVLFFSKTGKSRSVYFLTNFSPRNRDENYLQWKKVHVNSKSLVAAILGAPETINYNLDIKVILP